MSTPATFLTKDLMEKYIQMVRFESNPQMKELIKHHKEFILLTFIAQRAKRTVGIDLLTGLRQNEARIGDHNAYGLSEQQYRTAKKNLEKWKFATFKATNKGTIATLCSTSIYNINAEQPNDQNSRQATGKQRAANDKEECNNVNNVNNTSVNGCSLSLNIEEQPADKVPYQAIKDLYVEKTGKAVRGLSDSRKKAIKARWNEHGKTMKVFEEAFTITANSEFMNGQNDRGWTATFDWVINPNNFLKIIEGKYGASKAVTKPRINPAEQQRKEVEAILRRIRPGMGITAELLQIMDSGKAEEFIEQHKES